MVRAYFLGALVLGLQGLSVFSSFSNVDDVDVLPTYDKCTAIAVGKLGSSTGSPLTTHTADCAECDWRVNKVAARDWPEGSLRPIYLISGAYPRQVREDRGKTWSKDNLERDMPQLDKWEAMENHTIVGYIPQVPHTYALIEGMYGIMNEHNVAIGESTCAAKLFAAPITAGGKALLEVSELSQIGLERGKTARETIRIMGELAEKYGYYSAEWNVDNPYGRGLVLGEGGEALTVIDPDEAWVFHILPDPSGASAIWVAQRVPDNHIAAVANSFVIREVIPDHPDFMYSSNLWSAAEEMGWYNAKTDGLLHFVHTYAPRRVRSGYANRRIWRIFSVANPSSNLPPDTNAYADDYPFSIEIVRPEQGNQLSVQNIIDLQRDHFEGTQFSTGYGSLAGGPYGDPNRFDVSGTDEMTIWESLQGDFPRTISLFRTSYSFVAEPRKGEVGKYFPRMWFCQYAPDQSTYIPLYVTATALPLSWITGTMQRYDNKVAWWNFASVGNYASRFYVHAMVSVREVQRRLESELRMYTEALETHLLVAIRLHGDADKTQYVDELTSTMVGWGEYVTATWRDLFPKLLTTYRDGYIVGGQEDATVEIHRLFYPKWWLEKVGYFNNRGTKDALDDPNSIYFASNYQSDARIVIPWLINLVVTIFIAGGVGFLLGQRYAAKNTSESSPVASFRSSISPSISRKAAGSVLAYRPVPSISGDDLEECGKASPQAKGKVSRELRGDKAQELTRFSTSYQSL